MLPRTSSQYIRMPVYAETRTVAITAPHFTDDQQSEQSVRLGVFEHSFNPRIICIPLIVLANDSQEHMLSAITSAQQCLHSDTHTTSRHLPIDPFLTSFTLILFRSFVLV
jgi:hypothetical protein